MSILGAIADVVTDVCFEASLIPTTMDIKLKAKQLEWEDSNKKSSTKSNKKKPETKESEKVETKETKKSEETEVKNEESNSVIDLDEAKSKKRMRKLREKGNKIVTHALLYMSDGIEFDNGKLSEEDKSIYNSIASIFNFGKIFEDIGTADLRKYDLAFNSEAESQNYIFDLKSIKEIKTTPMGKRVEKNIQRMNQPDVQDAVTFEEDPENIIHPIHFTIEDEEDDPYPFLSDEPIKGKGISNNLFKKLENAFKPYLNGRRHNYTMMDNGLIRLFYDNGKHPCGMLVVDPGLIMGCGKIYVMAKLAHDFTFVDTDHKEIIEKLFENNFYQLTDEEYQITLSKLFRNTNHYTWVDLSNTSFMGKLSDEDFQKLGKKITFVLENISKERPNMLLPRMRITNWKSVNNFDMISDNKVISPMANDEGGTKGEIELGLKVQVRNDTMIEYKNDQKVSEYTVSEYGVM